MRRVVSLGGLLLWVQKEPVMAAGGGGVGGVGAAGASMGFAAGLSGAMTARALSPSGSVPSSSASQASALASPQQGPPAALFTQSQITRGIDDMAAMAFLALMQDEGKRKHHNDMLAVALAAGAIEAYRNTQLMSAAPQVAPVSGAAAGQHVNLFA